MKTKFKSLNSLSFTSLKYAGDLTFKAIIEFDDNKRPSTFQHNLFCQPCMYIHWHNNIWKKFSSSLVSSFLCYFSSHSLNGIHKNTFVVACWTSSTIFSLSRQRQKYMHGTDERERYVKNDEIFNQLFFK